MPAEKKTKMKVVLSGDVISRRVQELGRQISADLAGEPLVVISILKGAFMFTADLLRVLDGPVEVDFVRLKSYGTGTQTSGQVTITKDIEPDIRLKDKHVLVVEDIVDTGLTLAFLRDHILRHKPASVRICALIDKLERRERHVDLDYVGFTIKKGFIVGYGLDWAEKYRHLPDIHEITSGG